MTDRNDMTVEQQIAEREKIAAAIAAGRAQTTDIHGVRLPEFSQQAFAKLAEAFAKAQASLVQPAKGSTNPAFGSKYADLTACVNAATAALSKHGLSFMQTVEADGRTVTVVTIVLHEAGAWLSSGFISIPIGQARNIAQAVGSAITYAKRYSLCATLGISADEDDDANAVGSTQKQPVQKPRTNPAAVRPIAPQPAPVPAPAALDPEAEAKALQEFGWRIEEAGSEAELRKIATAITETPFGPAARQALRRTYAERLSDIRGVEITVKPEAPSSGDDLAYTYGS